MNSNNLEPHKIIWLRWLLFTLLVSFLVLRVFLLRNVPLTDWDESIYARVSWEMVQNHSLIPTYNNEVWLEKPPFMLYIYAAIQGLFLDSEVALRLGSVLLAAPLLYLLSRLTVFFLKTYFKFKDTLGSELLAWVAVLLFVTTPLVSDRIVLVNYDLALTLGWLLYFYASIFNSRPLLLQLLAIAIGVWSKSLLGYFPLAFEVFSKPIKKLLLDWKIYVILIGIPFLWYLGNYFFYGNYFIQRHLIDHIISRVTTPIELHFGGRLYYFQILWETYSYLSIVLITGYIWLAVQLAKDWKGNTLSKLYPLAVLCSPLVMLGILLVSKTKIFWYLVPVFPYFSILIVLAAVWVWQKNRIFGGIVFSLISIFIGQHIFVSLTPQVNAKPSELLTIAQCLQDNYVSKLAILVDKQERDTANVIEAAQIGIGSSFIYGGMPAFVYYSNTYPQFSYSVDKFKDYLQKNRVVMVTKEDSKILKLKSNTVICSSDKWEVSRL